MKWPSVVLAILVVLALVGFSVWSWTSAPCGMYRYSKASEIPARCIHSFR